MSWLVSFAIGISSWSSVNTIIFLLIGDLMTQERILRRFNVNRSQGLDIVNKSISSLFAIGSSVIGSYIILYSEGWSYMTQVWTGGYFLYDLYAMYKVVHSEGKSFSYFLKTKALLVAHHLAIVLLFIPVMSDIQDHPGQNLMIGLAFLMELSTPFVSLRSILHTLGKKNTTAYVINGILMTLIFFYCRVANYIYILHALKNVVNADSIFQVFFYHTPTRCKIWFTITLLPQLYWWSLMIKGAVHTIKGWHHHAH
uniref:Protein FAM57A n=1 Tax=Lepeophtheirus salmonis TaxID=72036 RepID=D3PIE0_LEPSM|nr:Protein FAM57A [Lepeophtheirus salmonis]